MEIKTTRFGDIEVDDDKIITFKKPILGFPNETKYVLFPHKEGSYFFWLQSVENPALAFPVLSPSLFASDYEFEVDDETQSILEIEKAEDVETLVIVTVPQGNPREATANLLSPLIINLKNNCGAQIILDPNIYPIAFPLFKANNPNNT